MTHYNIDYTKYEGHEKQQMAMQDIKSYMGTKAFDKANKVLKAEAAAGRLTRESMKIQLSLFVGIEGYPAEAWANELGLPAELHLVVNNSPDASQNPAETHT